MFVAGSIPEIRENAEAAMILQCDPDGMLEQDKRRLLKKLVDLLLDLWHSGKSTLSLHFFFSSVSFFS